ncbi:MAG: hypothetical protein HY240_04050 [Actinobacteria bacterium]|nr:hypothetical protein [Actinomycetota bacterium]
MEIGLFIRYGKLVPGREEQAIALFDEATNLFKERMMKGDVTFFEPFFFQTSDREEETGFMILKGPAPEIFRLMEDPRYLMLVGKAMLLVEHFQVDLLTVGDGIRDQLERATKVRAELGI